MRILKLKLRMTSHGFRIHFEAFISVSASLSLSIPPSLSLLEPKGQWLNDVFCGMHQPGGVQRICCVSLPDTVLSMASLWCRKGLSCCVPIYLLSCIGHLFVQFFHKTQTGLIATTTTSFPLSPVWHLSMTISTFSASSRAGQCRYILHYEDMQEAIIFTTWGKHQ